MILWLYHGIPHVLNHAMCHLWLLTVPGQPSSSPRNRPPTRPRRQRYSGARAMDQNRPQGMLEIGPYVVGYPLVMTNIAMENHHAINR
jgi:hypothetical protein